MPAKNDIVTLTITGMTAEGNGVGRSDGFAVFVPRTAVGDTVEVKLVKVLRSYAFGIVVRMLTPSPDRIEPDCPVFSRCGGCVFRHISYEAELSIKEGFVSDAFTRIGGLSPLFEPILPAPHTDHYRNKAQYPVGAGENGKLVCGFFAPRSHRIVPLTHCPLQPEEFGDIVGEALRLAEIHHIPAYDEQTHTGVLRHLYLRRGWHSGEIQFCFVATKAHPAFSKIGELLMSKFPVISSIILNLNPTRTNVILGKRCQTLTGKDTIADTMCGVGVELSPLSFYQVNTEQAERLYGLAREYAALSKEETLLDLYCGTGIIGLSMAADVRQLIGVDIVPDAIENARANAEKAGISNARFLCGDAAEAADTLRSEDIVPDCIVLDPPRKGCSPELLHTIAAMSPSRVVMISCNPATAARDCALLADLGYRCERVRAVDMFPRTGHVEAVIMMTYCGSDKKNDR